MRRIDALESCIVIACLAAVLAPAGCPGPAPVPVPPPAPGPAPPPPGPSPPPPSPIDPRAAVEAELLRLHNAERDKKGLTPLVIDPRLGAAARKHSDHMAKVDRLGHFGLGDADPWTRITAEGFRWKAASENVGWNEDSPAEAMRAWMSSPGHRANILGPYRSFGAGMARNAKGEPYWTTDFGTEERSEP
jgi:uncharacterized protein YkwD